MALTRFQDYHKQYKYSISNVVHNDKLSTHVINTVRFYEK